MAADEEAYGANVHKLHGKTGAPPPALVLHPAKLPDPRSIPPRAWLYGTQMLRGFVTVLVAPGGTGKSAYAMTVAAAMATGTPLLNEHVFARVNVAILNLEDPMDELNRRLAAIVIRHDIDIGEVEGRIFMHSGEERAVTMSATDDGFQVVHPDEAALTEQIRINNIGVVIVDPFAESHTLEENSNPHMVKAAAAWRRVARSTGCAVLLIHHVRKGLVADIDSARGAKGLTDSARVGLLLSPMGEDEAETLGIAADQRWQYVRLDNAKANMAPKAGKARWFMLDQVELHNGTQDYPSGDKVAAVIAWEPPNVIGELPVAHIHSALDQIAKGPAPGMLYTATRRGGSNRWVGTVMGSILGINDAQAASLVAKWLKSGLLFETTFDKGSNRHGGTGVDVDNTKRPE